MDAKSLSFVVPLTDEDGFFLETYDGKIFTMRIPEHIVAGQKIRATLEEDTIMLEYYHQEGDVGLASGGDHPKVVIGTRAEEDGRSCTKLKVCAQMNKHISFVVPTTETCMVELDDGRQFEITIPEHIAAGQHLVASIEGMDMLVAYYHTEGEVDSRNGEGSQLVIGCQIKHGSSDIAERVVASTMRPHAHK